MMKLAIALLACLVASSMAKPFVYDNFGYGYGGNLGYGYGGNLGYGYGGNGYGYGYGNMGYGGYNPWMHGGYGFLPWVNQFVYYPIVGHYGGYYKY